MELFFNLLITFEEKEKPVKLWWWWYDCSENLTKNRKENENATAANTPTTYQLSQGSQRRKTPPFSHHGGVVTWLKETIDSSSIKQK